MIFYNTNLYSFIQFTADPNDFYGNRLRSTELGLRLRLNLTFGFDKTAWPTDPDFLGYPTLVNAVYNRQGNQICKHRRILCIANNINCGTGQEICWREKFFFAINESLFKLSLEKISAMVIQYCSLCINVFWHNIV